MVNSEKQRSVDDREVEDTDRVDQANDNGFDDSSPADALGMGTSVNSEVSRDGGGSDVGVRITDRLTDILAGEVDGDLLLLQQSDRGEMVFQFLQALDLHVMGACRADERLKPLLKLNVSGGAAEDRLLANLSQHFEPSEVGMLARCLCLPLVSIRVGKINKQGTLLCPTATRGNLTLTLLPTSDLRISFIGDDGHSERLSTLRCDSQSSAVTIEEIPVDKSGRSFLIKIPDGRVFYFWCSEKSKLLGNELRTKMKDLLNRRPSLAELTGISESRLDCFVIRLHTYLVGSTVQNNRASSVVGLNHPLDTSLDSSELCQTSLSSSPSSKPLRSIQLGSPAGKSNSLYHGSLSPRSSSFKECLPSSSSSVRSLALEKLRHRGDSPFPVVDDLSVASQASRDYSVSNHSGEGKLSDTTAILYGASSNLLEFGKSGVPAFVSPASQVPMISSSLFSPHYCWCPPVASTLQCMVTPPQVPISLTQSLSVPPLSSLPPATRCFSTVLTPAPLNATDVPLDFPPLLSDPLFRLPLSKSSPQQIPTFKPLICDPVVRIPVIDVCSSGQGYLVSAGPAIITAIPPLLHSSVVNPAIPKTDSAVEESARETLRLLIGTSSQSNSQLMMMDVLPSLLTSTGEKQNISGSRGLCSGGGGGGGDEGFMSKQREGGGSDR